MSEMPERRWRDRQAPWQRSDVTDVDRAGITTIKCRNCEKFFQWFEMFRCFDCGSWLCRLCCWDHFGNNRHEPHPLHLHEYDAQIAELTAALADRDAQVSELEKALKLDLSGLDRILPFTEDTASATPATGDEE